MWVFFLFVIIYLSVAVLGVHCCVRAISSCGEWGRRDCSSLQCMAFSLQWLHLLWGSWSMSSRHTGFTSCTDSIAMGHGLSCSEAFVIFSQQRSNPCPLHWQVDSSPLSHQGSPVFQKQIKKREVVINKQRIDPLDDKLVLLKYNEACSQIGFRTRLLPYCYFKQ